jgi:hypothetical protein
MRIVTLFILLIGLAAASLEADVKIIQTQGKVMVRYGLEEAWQDAQTGAILKNIDTILSGEKGRVVLELEDGSRFELGANAILDIADIRKIHQKELFMYLMSQKIDNLEKSNENKNLKVGNVSVVHGQSKEAAAEKTTDSQKEDWYPLEINGALALYDHHYYPNTIIKFMKIQSKYGAKRDQGEIDYYIAKSFEELNDPGQARDAYQRALDEVNKGDGSDQTWVADARVALKRLDQE